MRMSIAHNAVNTEITGPVSHISDLSCQLLPVSELGQLIGRDVLAFDSAVGAQLLVLVSAANDEWRRAA